MRPQRGTVFTGVKWKLPEKPKSPEAIVFIDGQNLFYGVKTAFGYEYPNFDVLRLAERISGICRCCLSSVRFYTGMPERKDSEFWHYFWELPFCGLYAILAELVVSLLGHDNASRCLEVYRMVERPISLSAIAESLGAILRKAETLKVPKYQRSFAWEYSYLENLWADTMDAFEHNSEYFLGPIVLTEQGDIVDGQQRFTCLSILFSAIAHAFSQLDSEDAKKDALDVQRDYLSRRSMKTKEETPKLQLNRDNNEKYRLLVINRDITSVEGEKEYRKHKRSAEYRKMTKSNKNLTAAIHYLFARIRNWVDEFPNDAAKIAKLSELVTYLDKKVKLIVIEVGDEDGAFLAFETLNARGLDLAASDLIKNHVFLKGKHHIDELEDIWEDITKTLKQDGKDRNLTKFLRYYMLSRVEFVRERRLYKALKDRNKEIDEPIKFLKELLKYSDYYVALEMPDHYMWKDRKPVDLRSIQENVRALSIAMSVNQWKPLAMAALACWEADREIRALLEYLEAFAFRCIICRISPNKLEQEYSELACDIHADDKVKSLSDVKNGLYDRMGDDNKLIGDKEFEQQFAGITYDSRKSGFHRYILSKIERKLNPDFSLDSYERGDLITIEHITPRNPKKKVKGKSDQNEEQALVHNIGNLTLLNKGVNSGEGNDPYSAKWERVYSVSPLKLSSKLPEISEWGHVEISDRAAELAKLAVDIWRI